MNKRALINKNELIIIAVLIIIAAALYFAFLKIGKPVNKAEILYNNQIIKIIDLSSDGQYTVEQAPNMIFEISGGKARVLHSDCPDKICVKSGWLSRAGQSAVCLPNRITLRLTPDENTPDAVL